MNRLDSAEANLPGRPGASRQSLDSAVSFDDHSLPLGRLAPEAPEGAHSLPPLVVIAPTM